MISVKEVFNLKNNTTILVCDLFSDDVVTDLVRTDSGDYSNFDVLPIRECFTKARTRNIVFYDELDLSNVKSVQFV